MPYLAFLPYGFSATLNWTYLMQTMLSGANKTWATGGEVLNVYNGCHSHFTLTKEKYLPDTYGDEAVYLSTPQPSGSTPDFANNISVPMTAGCQPSAYALFEVGLLAPTSTGVTMTVFMLVKATLITRFSRFNILSG